MYCFLLLTASEAHFRRARLLHPRRLWGTMAFYGGGDGDSHDDGGPVACRRVSLADVGYERWVLPEYLPR